MRAKHPYTVAEVLMFSLHFAKNKEDIGRNTIPNMHTRGQ